MRWVRSRPNLATRDDDGPDILRVDNCSEVDVAGNFYKQDEKYYEKCYDFENEDAPEGADLSLVLTTVLWLISGLFITVWLYFVFLWLFNRCLLKHCPDRCYNIFCARCEPIVRNDNNATRYRTERSNISTISANIRQPSRRPPSPSAPPSSEVQEDLFDRLPKSKASKDQCAGQSKYFFWNL